MGCLSYLIPCWLLWLSLPTVGRVGSVVELRIYNTQRTKKSYLELTTPHIIWTVVALLVAVLQFLGFIHGIIVYESTPPPS